jgi:hypothetical protein
MKKLILIISVIFLSSCDQSEFKVNYCVVDPAINDGCGAFGELNNSLDAYRSCCFSKVTYGEFLKNK